MRPSLRIVIPALASLGLLACSSSDPLTSKDLASNSVTDQQLADKSVKNPKLADQAVDARTIAAAAVTSTAIADNAVTSPAIADGSVGTSELAAKAVTTGTIDDSAVTTPKINDGAVTAAKLASNAAVLGLNGLTGAVTLADGQNVHVAKSGNTLTVGLAGNVNAATLQGNDAATFARRDHYVITVAKVGGDFSTIQGAMNFAATGANPPTGFTWPGAPTATTPYVVHVGPGTYPEQVTMQPFIDIEGSGIGATTIKGTGTNNPVSDGVIKWPANVHSRLESLTVLSQGGAYGVAVNVNDTMTGDSTEANLWRVRLETDGALNDGFAVYLYGSGASFTAVQTEVVATGSGGSNTAANITVNAHLTCRDCTFSAQGATPTTLWGGSGTVVHVSNSLIDNPSNFSGTAKVGCVGNFDVGFRPIASANGC